MFWMPFWHMGRGAVPEPFRDPLKGGRKGSGPLLADALGWGQAVSHPDWLAPLQGHDRTRARRGICFRRRIRCILGVLTAVERRRPG
jgi:hypothetical protein